MTKGKASFRLTNLPNSTYVFLFAFVLASVLVPNFFTPGNITTMLTQACVMMTLSAAMSMCLMTGCIDLSLGGMVSMTGVVIAILLKNQVHAGLAILAGILSGTVFGMFNGFVVAKMKVPPFIATFGASGIAQSIANIISNERTISWEQGSHSRLIELLGSNVLTVYFGPKPAQILSISALLLMTVIILTIVLLVFKKTVLGSNIYALGANEETARLSGIDNVKWKIGIYAVSGFLAALAGMIVMIRTNSLQPTVGDGLEFQAVVAAVLGGNSMKGGKGSVPGAILGALTLYTVRNAMSLWGIDTSVVMVVIGGILVFGMIMNEIVNTVAEKRQLYRKTAGKEARL
ncbi:ABC transporter permease [Lacrimispora sp. 210928-DFI.3.58]|uniref:ABC transporter permease n=1 Tax=Lacrimispora sp. 210928-DFI.3.58 TaxID=2883214 RepID=UPI0015B6C971|nr:ABC transporter permease [Lacrimispora sp. 210928-DFI.3.58]